MDSMENRITKYFDERPELVQARLEEVKGNIAAEIEKNWLTILKNFQDAFDEVFQKGTKMQKAGAKGAIAYVCIGILRSSLMTKTYQMRIDLYDKNLHMDQRECASPWAVDFLFKWLDEDVIYFTKCARQKLVRIQDAEMVIFMQEYQENYFDILETFCAQHIHDVIQIKSWGGLNKEAQVKFTFGEFLDQGIYLKIVDRPVDEGSEIKNEW